MEDVPSDEEVIGGILRIAHSLRRRFDAQLALQNTSVPRMRLLQVMARIERPRMGDVAERLGLAPRTITATVDALERDGLVTRLSDVSDRRATQLELTPEGRTYVQGMREIQARLNHETVAPLAPDERRQLLELLSKLHTSDAHSEGDTPWCKRPSYNK